MRSLATALGVVAVAVCIAAATSAARTPVRSTHVSPYRHDGISFSYPAAWKRRNWCWEGTLTTPLVVLTTTHAAPACDQKTPWLPPERLGRGRLFVGWEVGGVPGLTWDSTVRDRPTTRVGREPARTALLTPDTATWTDTGCAGTRANVAIVTEIRPTFAADGYYEMTACLRGPDVAADERAVKTMLASVRFHHLR